MLDTVITVSQLVDWGGGMYATERRIGKWMGDRDSLTLGELLELPVDPWLQFWVLIRENFLPARNMHEAAEEIVQGLLQELQRQRVYLDFRCGKLLEAKRSWLDGQISLGQLSVAEAKGQRMCEDIAEIDSPGSIAAAHAAWRLMNSEPAPCLRGVLSVVDEFYEDEAKRRQLLELVARHVTKEP